MTTTITDINHAPSATYATANRAGEVFKVALNTKLPRWDDLTSNSYVEIDADTYNSLKQAAAEKCPIYK